MPSQKRTIPTRQGTRSFAGDSRRQSRLTAAAWVAILCAAIVAPAAQAQYKCVDGGRVTYAEKPCGRNAQAMHINVAPVSSDERAAVIQRAEREKVLAGQLETRRALGDELHAQRAAQFQQAAQQQKARCAELSAIAKNARDESSKYRYHGGLIDDARRRQKEAEDEHFSKCFGR